MKGLRELINNANLTKTQMVIANYVLDNSSEVCFMTSTDIAMVLGVSESSVIRFSRSLGFRGFMDFQKNLRKEYQDKVFSISSSITVPSQRMAKRSRIEDAGNYINIHYKNAAKNIEAVLINNSHLAFEEAADIIITSKRKFIVATRGNACLGDYALLYLKQMVPHVELTNSFSANPIDHLCHITKDDCVIFFSFPRYSSLDKLAAEMASKAGARIVVVTDKPSALLAQFATALLTAPVDSNAFFNCMTGAQFATELLCDTISHKVKGVEKRLQNIDRYIGELGIY
ncbi:MAG: MurR/RpiR family transcriptional regulator [Lachnospiraceae bacterium]